LVREFGPHLVTASSEAIEEGKFDGIARPAALPEWSIGEGDGKV
jgi:hypothetical protein